MHLLIQLKNRGAVTEDENLLDPIQKLQSGTFLSMEEIIAQCILFFLGGFETSATTTTFALLEMSLNLEIQKKLRTEIETVLKKYDGQITYEAVSEMKYLDMIVHGKFQFSKLRNNIADLQFVPLIYEHIISRSTDFVEHFRNVEKASAIASDCKKLQQKLQNSRY